MKPLADHMAVYAAFHQHPVNRAIHFLFVPLIVWGLMVALGLLDLIEMGGIVVTAAHVATVLLLAYYLALDFPLGVAATVVFTVLLVLALEVVKALSPAQAGLVAAGAFVLGFGVQFLGHGVWEKRRPALMTNLFQVFVAPIFLVAEAAFSLGLRRPLHDDVQTRMAPQR